MRLFKPSTNFFILFFLVVACVPKKEHEQVKAELASLTEAKAKEDMLLLQMDERMDSIGILLDSIEVQEEGIMLNLEDGIQYDDYVGRLSQIQDYMERTNSELRNLEEALLKSDNDNKVYRNIVANYKKMIAEKDETIGQLQEKIATYEEEKVALVRTVDLQNDELTELQNQVAQQQEEIGALSDDLDTSKDETLKVRAEKFYSIAQSTESLAEKTSSFLNGKKKKAYYRQAYDYYKQAFELDAEMTDAYDKMTELESKF
ncbi:MAG: hypothetical protein AAGI07_06375 [Bacteroidota bacterium]